MSEVHTQQNVEGIMQHLSGTHGVRSFSQNGARMNKLSFDQLEAAVFAVVSCLFADAAAGSGACMAKKTPIGVVTAMVGLEGSVPGVWAGLTKRFGSGGVVSIMSLLVVIVTSTSLLLYLRMKGRENSKVLPLGSLELPFWDDTWAFMEAYYNGTMKAYVASKARKFGTIFKVYIMGEKMVFFGIPGGSKFCFSHEELVQGWWPGSITSLVGPHSLGSKPNGDVFKTQRSHWQNSFLGVDVLPRYIPTMERISNEHLRKYWLDTEPKAKIKTEELISIFTFSLIAELVAGITDEAEIETLKTDYETFAEGTMSTPINLPGFMYHHGHQARARITKTLTRYVQRRKQELKQGLATPTQDLMAVLLTHPDPKGRIYSDDEIVGNLLSIMWGGFDTTKSTLTSIMWHMGKAPNVYEELRKEHDEISSRKTDGEALTKEDVRSMKGTWRVIQETLRILPAVQVIYREALETFEYNGYTIPKGWKVVLSAAQIRAPEKFRNPDVFDPSRFERGGGGGAAPYTFFPFGGGCRLCPGYEFAKISMLVFLHCLIKSMKWSIVDPEERIFYGPFPTWEKHMLITIQTRSNKL